MAPYPEKPCAVAYTGAASLAVRGWHGDPCRAWAALPRSAWRTPRRTGAARRRPGRQDALRRSHDAATSPCAMAFAVGPATTSRPWHRPAWRLRWWSSSRVRVLSMQGSIRWCGRTGALPPDASVGQRGRASIPCPGRRLGQHGGKGSMTSTPAGAAWCARGPSTVAQPRPAAGWLPVAGSPRHEALSVRASCVRWRTMRQCGPANRRLPGACLHCASGRPVWPFLCEIERMGETHTARVAGAHAESPSACVYRVSTA